MTPLSDVSMQTLDPWEEPYANGPNQIFFLARNPSMLVLQSPHFYISKLKHEAKIL